MAVTSHPREGAREHFWQVLRLSPCPCGPRDLVRLRRTQWLRWLFPRRRLYQCPHCASIVFYGR